MRKWLHNAPPLKGKAVNRAATALPYTVSWNGYWVRTQQSCAASWEKKEWKARLAAAVDTAYNDHWLSIIRAKLAKPTTAKAPP
jgi:hypothetical protein